jgi:4-diphosphocytidyl-2-C-methyl-D-erythritol kinase
MPTRVRSHSKINLGLGVGPVRSDGFHGLTTVYQTLALYDIVTVSAKRATETKIQLTADHAGVPRSETGNAEKNTAWKMVSGALERLGITADVAIDIQKRLPVQGGMGAGSANAVAALLGLERELGIALPGPERLELAAEVGSDVPLFLLGGTVLGQGRGEAVSPLPDFPATPCVIAIPKVGVSTGLAFRELDAKMAAALTFQQGSDRLEKLSRALAAVWMTNGVESGTSGIAFMDRSELVSGDLLQDKALIEGDVSGDLAENPLLALVRTGIENDFEEVVFSQHPSLRSTKRDLLGTSGSSAIFAGLSGSGSALFGLYRSQADASEAQYRVQQSGMRAILTETLPRRPYWDTMFAG